MKNKTTSSLNKRQGKNKEFKTQLQIVFDFFYKKPSTMLMVSVQTGIMRANICWYIHSLLNQNKIFLIKKGICPVSKYSKVGFYTTNPKLIPENTQLKLF